MENADNDRHIYCINVDDVGDRSDQEVAQPQALHQ